MATRHIAPVPQTGGLEQAKAAAEAAAALAGLRVVQLDDVRRIQEGADLFNAVWSATKEEPLIPANTLRALEHSGNYVFGAYDGDRIVGAIVGFLGLLDGAAQLHSHILGVAPMSQGRNVGFALKQHQRAWALAHGIDVVTWTFDPLVRRNAYFNISKLGADVRAYYPDFYGTMSDGINDGDESDRVLVAWPLLSPHVVAASEGHSRELDVDELESKGAVVALKENGDGDPVASEDRGPVLVVSVPEDIVAIRRNHKERADRWRRALRDVLHAALQDGYLAAGTTRAGWYVLRDGSAR